MNVAGPGRRRWLIGSLAVICCAPWLAFPAWAEPSTAVRAEIDYLLGYIRESSCSFVRNGRAYGTERAYRHVVRKFNYFEDKIESAEDFIELAATRSTVSGRPYQFVCDGVARESGPVLREVLQRHRAAADR